MFQILMLFQYLLAQMQTEKWQEEVQEVMEGDLAEGKAEGEEIEEEKIIIEEIAEEERAEEAGDLEEDFKRLFYIIQDIKIDNFAYSL